MKCSATCRHNISKLNSALSFELLQLPLQGTGKALGDNLEGACSIFLQKRFILVGHMYWIFRLLRGGWLGTRSRGGPATGRCGGHTQVSRQAKHYAHKGINALSCDKAFQNPCHSAKRERKYVQQHIRICTHGVKTRLG